MSDLRETLEALARLEPERFYLVTRDLPTVYMAHLGGKRLTVSSRGDDLSLAILAAALRELIDAKRWTWLRTHDNAVYIRDPSSNFYPPRNLSATASGPEPFALVLAKAVVQALEATP